MKLYIDSINSSHCNDNRYLLLKKCIEKNRVSNIKLDNITSIKNTNEKLSNFDKLIVLGDSLSDSGNIFKRFKRIFPSAIQYYKGRFTNGFTWVDHLSKPNLLFNKCVNLSYGGAVAGNYKLKEGFACHFLSSIKKQLKKVKTTKNDLAIMMAGANDYMTYKKDDVDRVIKAQKSNMTKLIKKGTKNIIIAGIPDISHTPSAKSKTNEQRARLTSLSMEHNEKVRSLVNEMSSKHKDIKIHFFDTNKIFESVIEEAKELPGYVIDKSYYSGSYVELNKIDEMVSDHKHIFNDRVHPSEEVHAILAYEFENFIKEKFL